MKILYAPDTSDHQNWGCQIMGLAYRLALHEAGARGIARIPSAWFFPVNSQIPDLTRLSDLHAFAQRVASGNALPDLARVLQACDVVFCNAENFIRPGAVKGRRLLLLAYLAKKVFNKPCILANVSVDLSEPALAEIAATVFPLLDEVQFREETSIATASGLVRPGCWRYVPDIAWAIPAAPLQDWVALARRPGYFNAWPDVANGFDPEKPYVTVSASSIHGLAQHKAFDPTPAYVALCGRLREAFGQVLLVAPDQPDIDIARKVQAALDLPVLGTHFPVRQGIDVLGNASVHLGGRWHPGIFASTGGTPLVAFSTNNHKMRSLVHDLNSDDPVFNALDLTSQCDDIIELARRKIDAGQALRDRIQLRSRELAGQVPAGMATLRDYASRFDRGMRHG